MTTTATTPPTPPGAAPRTTPADLDARYGRDRRRRWPWVLLGAAALALVGYLGTTTVMGSWLSVDADDRGYAVLDERTVRVEFQFVAPTDRPVFCALEALDPEFGVVGWRIVEYPPSSERLRFATETIPTVAAATTGLVNSCWVA